MQHYIAQLLNDIKTATEMLAWPYVRQSEVSVWDFKPYAEEKITATVRNLSVWTGISPEMLPPEGVLTNAQVQVLLEALNKLLSECNCHVVFQTQVPERIQYESIRQNFDQDVKVLQWNEGFFEFCKPGTALKTCSLGSYCQCAFYEEVIGNSCQGYMFSMPCQV